MQFSRYMFLTDALSVIRKLNFFNPLITGKTSYHNSTSLLIWVVPIFSTQMESHRNSPVLPGSEYPYLFYIIELFPVLF